METSLFLSLLPPEKADALRRGEAVQITGEESIRFQLAYDRVREARICRTPCLFKSKK